MKSLFRSLAVLPLPMLHALGIFVGWSAFLLSPTYRRRFLANVQQAGFSVRELPGAVAQAGKLIAETPRLWFGRMPRVAWENPGLVDAARAGGRGLIFLTPHLGCFEITAQAYAERFGPVTVLYRPARKAWLRDLVDTARVRPNLATAPATLAGVRQMLRTLRADGVIGLLPDQVPPAGLGVWAPFFGRDAYTMTLPARLAQQTGASLLLIWGERLSWGRGYVVRVRPWEGGELPADGVAAATLVNAQMERLVREAPTQYLWSYARYKQPREEIAP